MRPWLAAAFALVAACGPAAPPAPSGPPLPVVELKYRVFDEVGRPSYCDPDFYPVARADEKDLARERLPEMQADAEAYAALLRHNDVPAGSTLTDEQLLRVYRDWKDLRVLELRSAAADVYGFVVTVRATDEEGDRIEGRIDVWGRVTVLRREDAGPLICPICLADHVRIDTPTGPVRVADLRVGDIVWTATISGARMAAPIVKFGHVDAPAGHEVVRIRLADGRDVTASPGHPTADGRTFAALRAGDELDGSRVISSAHALYRGRTYDLLPAGVTGTYWANGVPLRSTLAEVAPGR